MRYETNRSCECSGKMGLIVFRPLWVLNVSLLARAAHQVGAAIFLATFLLDTLPRPPYINLYMIFISGGILLFVEFWRHSQFYREMVGAVTLVKLTVLGAVWHGLLSPPHFVLLAFLVASIGAHLPKRVRHRLIY